MNVLDGRNFVGIVLECGKTEGDADTIIFKDGRFRSTACDRYEYGDGPYTETVAGDMVSFEAQNPEPEVRKPALARGRARPSPRRHADHGSGR